eukprot:comp9531_c0_seq1/m.4560 comp9531_c0_seq1/g.4560  ORF comp9531_c0_seq1/g.4560 comp9531_c0_seq1/m.4560 type:complete len:290 (-) comp9531_c0_seq1:439-1308(-)
MGCPSFKHHRNMMSELLLAQVRWCVRVLFLLGLLSQVWAGDVVLRAAGEDGELRIACLGDSLTYGNGMHLANANGTGPMPNRGNYPMMMEKNLKRIVKAKMGLELKVGNFGLKSATAMKLRSFPRGGDRAQVSYWDSAQFVAAKEFNPHLVIILLGTNDAKIKTWTDKARQFFSADYRDLISEFSKPTNPSLRKMLLALPPTAHSDKFYVKDVDLQSVVRPMIEKIATDLGLDTIDMRAVLAAKSVEAEQEESFCMGEVGDGVHPCARGAAKMAAAASKAVRDWMSSSQ